MSTHDIDKKLAALPGKPGIYKMLDKHKKIIYIGKAKNLRSRVKSYFHGYQEREITSILVKNIADIEIIITRTEKEALLLENNLIKEFKPYFNIDLKDNKTFPYIRITDDEKYPRIIKTREAGKKGRYFGPYTDVSIINYYLEVVNEFYPLKKCRRIKFPRGFKPCLYYHMGKCLGYCTGKTDSNSYQELIREVSDILNGKSAEIIGKLKEQMRKLSKVQNYEKAMELKNRIEALQKLDERQTVNLLNDENFDVINFFISDGTLNIAHLLFREGKLLNKEAYNFQNKIFTSEDIFKQDREYIIDTLSNYLIQYYSRNSFPVSKIYLPLPIINFPALGEAISDIFTRMNEIPLSFKTKLAHPLRGDKKRLMELALSNARLSFYELIRAKEKERSPQRIKELLKLKKVPKTIESFDIANTGDMAIVAGMVRFTKEQKDKSNYRIFNIHSSGGQQNDFQAMNEAVYRRYSRLLKENKTLPDLIMIDGGKGQLSAAVDSLKRLGIKGQPIISIAKQEEEIYVPKLSDPIKVPLSDPGLIFLLEIRDETHRFTNKSHILKRDKEELKSILSDIPGLGPRKTRSLMVQYDSIEDIKTAGKKEILGLPFFSEKDFLALRDYFMEKNDVMGRGNKDTKVTE